MHSAAWEWVRQHAAELGPVRRVLEQGSRNVNGGVRELFADAEYVGVDCAPGPGVDVVADAAEFVAAPCDLVICCETLEHTPRGADLCRRAYESLRVGGVYLVTAAAPARGPHSAVDGGPLRPGEWYRNVDPGELRVWLRLAGFGPVLVCSWTNPGDVYALAVRSGGVDSGVRDHCDRM